MSHTTASGYPQLLLKTVLKRAADARDFHAIPSILAVCTIVVRALQTVQDYTYAVLTGDA
jgi:hypothetical protein